MAILKEQFTGRSKTSWKTEAKRLQAEKDLLERQLNDLKPKNDNSILSISAEVESKSKPLEKDNLIQGQNSQSPKTTEKVFKGNEQGASSPLETNKREKKDLEIEEAIEEETKEEKEKLSGEDYKYQCSNCQCYFDEFEANEEGIAICPNKKCNALIIGEN